MWNNINKCKGILNWRFSINLRSVLHIPYRLKSLTRLSLVGCAHNKRQHLLSSYILLWGSFKGDPPSPSHAVDFRKVPTLLDYGTNFRLFSSRTLPHLRGRSESRDWNTNAEGRLRPLRGNIVSPLFFCIATMYTIYIPHSHPISCASSSFLKEEGVGAISLSHKPYPPGWWAENMGPLKIKVYLKYRKEQKATYKYLINPM